MFRLFIFTLMLSSAIASITYAEEGWFPYYFPADPAKAPDYQGMPASTFNAGKDVLDAPAGKHGFVKAKGGHFYFEDGTRAKFWGTNLCSSACFPEKRQAEITANRIAYFGFNAVRLHHMDCYFEPSGIFEDVCPAYKDAQMKKTGLLSKRQLARLDYLIYQLKKRGVYVDINLLVSRRFTGADGVIDAEKLGMAAKPVCMFDPRLVELQKQYAKDLLTHFNPYTKLRYCDDPAICLVEIVNECTLTKLDRSKLPEYYKKELQGLAQGLSPTCPEPSRGKGTVPSWLELLEKQYLQQMTTYLRDEIGIKCPIGIGGHWNKEQLKIQQECLDYADSHAYWDHPQFPRKSWDMNDFTIHNKSMLADTKLGIIGVLNAPTPSTLDPRPRVLSEWNHCYPNQYAYETPILLAQEALKNDWDALFQFAWAHSQKDLVNYDNINSYFNINSNAQQLILCSYASRIFLKGAIPQGAHSTTSDITIGVGCPFGGWPLEALEIKNTGSGWNSKGRFDWGTAPTLMKNCLTK